MGNGYCNVEGWEDCRKLDLYHFIEKVVRNLGQVKIRRKMARGNKAEQIVGVVRKKSIAFMVLAIRKSSFSPI
jgi:hypothetical protein